MLIDGLLSKRLVLLSGKGGVGKSVVGLAMALAARERGQRVLLVEIDAPLEAGRFLGAGPVGTKATGIGPGLFAVNLNPRTVMDEYVRHVVRLDFLARRLVDNPIYTRFFAAAPGLKELMTLGKIMVLEEQKDGWSRRPLYDLIVVDAPATGHGLSFLRVPTAAFEAVPLGPIHTNAGRILKLLRDPRRTALVIVAVPEEMAVVEALQFHDDLVKHVRLRPAAVVLNACHERRFTEPQEREILELGASGAEGRLAGGVRLEAALDAARRHIRRRKLTRFYRTRLERALSLPLVSLPYLYREELGPEDVRALAERLEAAP
jgi:anion-transporting  ArsA/GET3 family ATPase